MSQFQFRFETLLKIHESTRDAAAAEVGQANEAIAKIEMQINELETQRQQSRSAASDAASGTNPSPDRLLTLGRYGLQLQAEHTALVQTLTQLQTERDRRQSRLADCETEVKRLERLREVKQDQFHADQLRRDQAIIDDQAASRHQRRNMV
ncbi:MAG: flagellar export protein FliJ [Planctomycetota bacterium]